MPQLAQELDNWEPQPDPLDQEIKQLEILKLQAEIDEIHSRTAENQTDAVLNLSKAREADSNADLTDLNFVEQESGVTQEREIELHGEQARSNMALETHKAALTGQDERQSALDRYLSKRNPR